MRILVNIDDLEARNGIAVQTFQVSRELARRGHEVDIAYLRGGSFEAEYRAFARRVVRVPAMSIGRRPWGVHRLIRAIFAGVRLRPDVVYDNLLWALPWSASVAAISRAGVVGHMHGFSSIEPSRVTRFFILRTAKRVLCVSEHSRAQMLEIGADPATLVVVHNGIDPAVYPPGGQAELVASRRVLGLSDDAYVVLFVGRIDPVKGIETLLEAARLLGGDDLELLLVGPPVSEEYLRTVQELGAGLRCRWLPAQSDIVPVLHAADVVAMPSTWEEPFGRVAIEALATGRPVVASRTGGLVEVMAGALDRFLVAPGDRAELAAALDGLRYWRRDEPELAQLCTEHVRRSFNVATSVDRIEEELAAAQR